MNSMFGRAVELRVPSRPEYVAIVRALVTDIARRTSLPASAVEDVQVAASEACTNVVRHAYSDPDRGSAEILVRCITTHGRLIIEVADSGCGFTNPIAPAYDLDRDGGLGLLLMHHLMDKVSLDSTPERGTTVRMVKNAGASKPHKPRESETKLKVPVPL